MDCKELKLHNQILKIILKFKTKIISIIIIRGLTFLIFKTRLNLKNFIWKLYNIYQKIFNKVNVLNKKRFLKMFFILVTS